MQSSIQVSSQKERRLSSRAPCEKLNFSHSQGHSEPSEGQGKKPSAAGNWPVFQLAAGRNAPADFMADPDGSWEYEQLLAAAGYDPSWGQVQIGALTEDFEGFVEGSAVVAFQIGSRCSVALIDCVGAL